MKDAPQITRREWLRLRKPHQNHWLGETSAASRPDTTLDEIETPPNHGGLKLDELPPLREAALSNDEVSALLDDIHSHGQDIQLMQKRRPAQLPAAVVPPSNMAAAKTAFLSGSVQRLQIRYRWHGALWIDTLEQQGTHTRLVRVSHNNL